MDSSSKAFRIIFATSLVGIILTFVFQELSSVDQKSRVTRTVLGKVISVEGLAEYKGKEGYIWQELEPNQELDSHMILRTKSGAAVSLSLVTKGEIFLDSETQIEMDLERNTPSFRLDSGAIFFRGGAQKSGSSVILNIGATTFDSLDADFTMASDDGKNGQIEIYRGTTSVENSGRVLLLEKNQKAFVSLNGLDIQNRIFKVQKPLMGEPIAVRTDRDYLTHIQWEPLTSDFLVKLFIGNDRNLLSSLGAPVRGDSGEFAVKLPPSTYYWRLVAYRESDPDKLLVSAITRNKVTLEEHPLLLTPTSGEQIYADPEDRSILFRWLNLSKLIKLQIEIASDEKFKDSIFADEVEDSGSFRSELLKEGPYYWRLSGFRSGSAVSLTSSPQYFSLVKSDGAPPILRLPLSHSTIDSQEINEDGLLLSWGAPLGIKKFKVVVRNEKQTIFDQIIENETMMRLPDLPSGDYTWNVSSISRDGHLFTSESRVFTVDSKVNTVASKNAPRLSERNPASMNLASEFSWDRLEGSQSYFVEVLSEAGQLVKTFDTTSTFVSLHDLKPGRYLVHVASVSKRRTIGLFSSQKVIEVTEAAGP